MWLKVDKTLIRAEEIRYIFVHVVGERMTDFDSVRITGLAQSDSNSHKRNVSICVSTKNEDDFTLFKCDVKHITESELQDIVTLLTHVCTCLSSLLDGYKTVDALSRFEQLLFHVRLHTVQLQQHVCVEKLTKLVERDQDIVEFVGRI